MTSHLERPHPLPETIFRTLFSMIFIVAGFGHVVSPETIVHRLEAAPLADLATSVAPAHVLVTLTGAVLLVAGVALFLGVRTRPAAIALIACLVPITLVIQLEPGQTGPLFKNVALLGGLIHFLFSGAGETAFSIDRWRTRGLPVAGAQVEA